MASMQLLQKMAPQFGHEFLTSEFLPQWSHTNMVLSPKE